MNTKSIPFATEHGKAGKLTDDAILTVIGILQNYELAMTSYDYEAGCAVPDEWEIEDANHIVTMIAFLEKELAKREERKVANAVWKVAAEKGWDKSNPAHKAHINAIIADAMVSE